MVPSVDGKSPTASTKLNAVYGSDGDGDGGTVMSVLPVQPESNAAAVKAQHAVWVRNVFLQEDVAHIVATPNTVWRRMRVRDVITLSCSYYMAELRTLMAI
jgi:hypothetical protein